MTLTLPFWASSRMSISTSSPDLLLFAAAPDASPVWKRQKFHIHTFSKGGKWSFKNYGSYKILDESHGSHSLVFEHLANSIFSQSCLAVSYFVARSSKSQSTYSLVLFYKWCVNILEPEDLKLTFNTLWYVSQATSQTPTEKHLSCLFALTIHHP